MQVVTQNPEKKLIQELRDCWENFPTQRCMHMKLSSLDKNTTDFAGSFVKTAYEQLDDKSLQIYICQDSDIFVLSRFLTKKNVGEIIKTVFQDNFLQLAPEIANLYDIGVDFQKLRSICLKKIEFIEQKKREYEGFKHSQTEIVMTDIAISEIDIDLIYTLKARRELRKSCEVMIVEDDAFSQSLVKNLLKTKYDVISTYDGFGAVINYAKEAPDILFLDIGLPDINGHEVLKRIFEIDPAAYVIMLSANGDRENVLNAVGLGAKGFIAKPFTQEKIMQYIEKSPYIQAKKRKDNSNGNSLC